MTSLVSRASLGLSRVMRTMGSALDNMGKTIEITKYTEKLVPSTRFVAVDGIAPKVSEYTAFVAPSASVVGDVTIGKNSSVWYGAIVRGDVNTVTIGEHSIISDRAVVHVAKIQGDFPTVIGNQVTISAGALVHAATLRNGVVVGESAQVLDGAEVGENSVILPGSIVTPGTKVPAGEVWGGSPAKKMRTMTEEEIAIQKRNVLVMTSLAVEHAIEQAKDYTQILEEAELADIELHLDESLPHKQAHDPSDVQGQGHPGRIFRSTLTHPEEVYKKK